MPIFTNPSTVAVVVVSLFTKLNGKGDSNEDSKEDYNLLVCLIMHRFHVSLMVTSTLRREPNPNRKMDWPPMDQAIPDTQLLQSWSVPPILVSDY